MSRVMVWSLIGALFGGGLAGPIADCDEAEGQMPIVGDVPRTEDQVSGQMAILG